MSDDWNLKGRRINEPDCERCSKENIYGEIDIETLREKLIEDLKWCGGDMTTEDEMRDIINKRFGVIE